ncbi:hypothetical protein J6590_023072 [Homalodisca vitripennis]|nr:hypothetical protein J6590_023072 [Homalodisca vitripennis]
MRCQPARFPQYCGYYQLFGELAQGGRGMPCIILQLTGPPRRVAAGLGLLDLDRYPTNHGGGHGSRLAQPLYGKVLPTHPRAARNRTTERTTEGREVSEIMRDTVGVVVR